MTLRSGSPGNYQMAQPMPEPEPEPVFEEIVDEVEAPPGEMG